MRGLPDHSLLAFTRRFEKKTSNRFRVEALRRSAAPLAFLEPVSSDLVEDVQAVDVLHELDRTRRTTGHASLMQAHLESGARSTTSRADHVGNSFSMSASHRDRPRPRAPRELVSAAATSNRYRMPTRKANTKRARGSRLRHSRRTHADAVSFEAIPAKSAHRSAPRGADLDSPQSSFCQSRGSDFAFVYQARGRSGQKLRFRDS